MTSDFARACLLLLVVLNPLALSVYLIDVYEHASFADFSKILLRASFISALVFSAFACWGPGIFSDVLQLHFSSFQVFGGILFLLVALRFMLSGSQALVTLRGEPSQIAGAVAMPFMIGPGTVSAAASAGFKLERAWAVAAVVCALLLALAIMFALKFVFDRVKARDVALTKRYVELASRVSAMLVGSIAVEMIFSGAELWWKGAGH